MHFWLYSTGNQISYIEVIGLKEMFYRKIFPNVKKKELYLFNINKNNWLEFTLVSDVTNRV